MNIATIEQKERSAQFLWMGFIILFFVIQAIIWTFAIIFTSNDISHAVVAGYDEKALHWDEWRAEQIASESLGWSHEILVDPASDIRSVHAMTLTLSDDQQNLVQGATIELTAFHGARAGQPQTIKMTEVNEGVYSGKIEIKKTGKWKLSGAANKGADVFLIEEQLELKASQ